MEIDSASLIQALKKIELKTELKRLPTTMYIDKAKIKRKITMEYNRSCTSTGCSQQVLGEVDYNNRKEINYYSHNQRKVVKLSMFGSKMSDNQLCYYHMKEDMLKRGLLQPGKEVI